MEIWEAILLGLIQGLCEFLPISSSGHLVLFQRVLGVEGDMLLFNVLLHFATLLAVCIVLYSDVIDVVKKPLGRKGKNLLVSFIPTAILAFTLQKVFPNLIEGKYVAAGFMLSAIVLAATAILTGNKKGGIPLEQISYKSAFITGIVQGIAVVPGLSRSASTISALSLQKTERESAVKFSFLMSIPVIAASAAYELLTGDLAGIPFLPLIAGFAAAFCSGYLSVKFMLKIFTKKSPLPFIIYLMLLSVLSFFI